MNLPPPRSPKSKGDPACPACASAAGTGERRRRLVARRVETTHLIAPPAFAGATQWVARRGNLRLTACAALPLILAACGSSSTPTLFIPPTAGAGPIAAPPASTSSVPQPSATTSISVPTIIVPTPTPPCTAGLTYVEDLTIPDGSNIAPGQPVDKQWLVANSGTCDWDVRYRLKLIGGDALGVPPVQALYPARAGTQATIRIVFLAPQQAGLYQSQWQAADPDGRPFGDAFYIQISVSP